MICDAGGGTVDVVSYRVSQLEPNFAFEPITLPTGMEYVYSFHFQCRNRLTKKAGAKCGSTFIDGYFKHWLNYILGDRHYRELDAKSASQRISAHATEGKQMREVMKQFEAHKRNFFGNADEMKIDLPEPLDSLNIAGIVNGGELTITKYEYMSPPWVCFRTNLQ